MLNSLLLAMSLTWQSTLLTVSQRALQEVCWQLSWQLWHRLPQMMPGHTDCAWGLSEGL